MPPPDDPPGEAGAGAGGGGSPPPPPAFFTGIKDEGLRGWVEQAGYKDLDGFAKSHRDTVAMRGKPAEAFIEMPTDWNNADQVKAYNARIGVPGEGTMKAYGFEGGAFKLPEGAEADPKFFEAATSWMHEAGLRPAQAQALVTKWSEFGLAQLKAENEARETASTADIAKLKGEWGQNYPVYEEQARRAFRKFGGDDAQMAAVERALGTAAFLKHYQHIGEGMGEGAFHEDGPGAGAGGRNFTLSPTGAAARKEALMSDKEWTKRYMAGDATAKKEMDDLNQVIVAAMSP